MSKSLRNILSSTLLMGASSGAVMVLDLVRVKATAVFLGPGGVGVLSVLNHFHAVVATLAALGLGTGIARYTARYSSRGETDRVQRVLSHGFRAPFLVAVAVMLGLCAFARPVSKALFGSEAYSLLIIVYAASLPIGMYPTVVGTFLQGLKRIRALAEIKVLKSLAGLAVIVPLIYWLGLLGAALGILVFTATDLLLNRRYLARERVYRAWTWTFLDRGILKSLMVFGATSLLVGSAFQVSHLLFKVVIVDLLGQTANGVYQPVWALTMTYPTLVLSSMSAYSYPRLCELTDRGEIVGELNDIIRVALLLITPVMLFLLAFRSPIVRILYSREFLGAVPIMPVQILGDFFKVAFWGLSMYLLPTRRLSAFIVFNLAQDALLFGLAWLLIPSMGLHGAAAAFAASYGLPLFVLYFYSRRAIGYSASGGNIRLMASTLALLAGAVVLIGRVPSWGWWGFLAGGSVAWGMMNVSRREAVQGLVWGRDKLSRFT
ncbi:MAG: oligosaccharide flippase family protein, partial [Pseudomonadota bacterium]